MNCDIFRHTYDELECHRFSEDYSARHKIYDAFLLICHRRFVMFFSSQWRHQNKSSGEKSVVSDVIIISHKV
jgi:hypothetical protein